ncbi:hypothetical protein C8F01DRAFT_1093160 [Mycena amicta]|nr:hypothetical protein C8F01DRAFT_1093160 [Mycena amicta]
MARDLEIVSRGIHKHPPDKGNLGTISQTNHLDLQPPSKSACPQAAPVPLSVPWARVGPGTQTSVRETGGPYRSVPPGPSWDKRLQPLYCKRPWVRCGTPDEQIGRRKGAGSTVATLNWLPGSGRRGQPAWTKSASRRGDGQERGVPVATILSGFSAGSQGSERGALGMSFSVRVHDTKALKSVVLAELGVVASLGTEGDDSDGQVSVTHCLSASKQGALLDALAISQAYTLKSVADYCIRWKSPKHRWRKPPIHMQLPSV